MKGIDLPKPSFATRQRTLVDAEYKSWLKDIKLRYRNSQIKASVKVNDELLKFYWSLGRDIVAMHADSRYGSTFFDTLSMDLRREFPDQKGFSSTNLKYIRRWYAFYNQGVEIRHQVGDDFSSSIRQQVVDDFKPRILHQVGAEFEMPENFALLQCSDGCFLLRAKRGG
jgi:hypothetical protein